MENKKFKYNLLRNKKGFLIRDFIVASILFSGIFALFGVFILGVSTQYDNPTLVNEDILNNYDKLTDNTDKITTALDAARTGEGLGFKGTFDVVFAGTFTVWQLAVSSLDLLGSVISSVGPDFGLDTTVVGLLGIIGLSILTTTLVYVWISSISRGKL